MKKGENVVLCGLCGMPIETPKGTQKGKFSKQQEQGAHNNCLEEQHKIMKEHVVNPNIEVGVILRGLIELHPEVEQTKAVSDYRNREDEMKEELFVAFPYLKKREEDMEKFRKDVEEKVEEAKE